MRAAWSKPPGYPTFFASRFIPTRKDCSPPFPSWISMSTGCRPSRAAFPIPRRPSRDLVKVFPVRGDRGEKLLLRAVNRVSFEIGDGETLGLVGESGSGKSTIGRLVVGVIPV